MSKWRKQVIKCWKVWSFCDRQRVQPPSLKVIVLTFLVKMVKWSFPGSLYFENTRENFKSNLVLVVVLESKALYYVESANGQGKENPAFWFATRAGEMGPPCQLGISRVRPARKKFTFWPYNRSFFDQACSVKRAVYWPHSLLCFHHNYDKILKAHWLSTVLISALIGFDFTSVQNYAKRTWPMTSHIGQTLVNNAQRNYYHSTNGT